MQTLAKIWRLRGLRRRLLVTLFICILFLFTTHIPTPGFTAAELNTIRGSEMLESGLFRVASIFTGGALANASVVALGLFPMLEATGILEALRPLIPALDQRLSEPGSRQRYWKFYVMALTILIAALSAWLGEGILLPAATGGWLGTATRITTLTAGSLFIVWLADLITQDGIGSGPNILILTGILSSLPLETFKLISAHGDARRVTSGLIVYGVFVVGMVWLTIQFKGAQRRVPIQYARHMRGRRRLDTPSTYIPITFLTTDVQEPVEMALVLLGYLYVGLEVLGLSQVGSILNRVFPFVLAILIFGLTYLFVNLNFEAETYAENLQREGGFIPNVRPGLLTARHLDDIVTRLTLISAVVFTVVCMIPYLYQLVMGLIAGGWEEPMYTLWAWWVVPGIVIDTLRQINAQLMMHDYQSMLP